MVMRSVACRVASLLLLAGAACWAVPSAAQPASTTPPGEPPPPAPSVAIQKSLDEARVLLESHQLEKAIEVVSPAIDDARRRGDRAGEAAAHRLHATALQELDRHDEAIGEWRAAEKAAGLAGDTPGRIEALASAAILMGGAGTAGDDSELIGQAVALARAETLRPLATAAALQSAGKLFYGHERDAGAERLLAVAVEIREAKIPGSPDHAESLERLGNCVMGLGDTDRAETLLRRALEIQERTAPESAAVAVTLRGLGELGLRRDDLATAEKFLDRSRMILERTAPGSKILAGVYNLLGAASGIRNDTDSAAVYFQQALAIYEKTGERSVGLTNLLLNLGINMRQRGDFASARDYIERALAIQQEIDPGSLAVGRFLDNLARLYRDFGDLENAKEHARRALEIFETLAPDSDEIMYVHWMLADIARSQHRYADARSGYERALAMVERASPGGPREVSLRVRLGTVEALQGEDQEADGQLHRALEIAESLAGESTAFLESALTRRAWLFAWRGDLEGAKADLLRWKNVKEGKEEDKGFSFFDLGYLEMLGSIVAATGDRNGGLDTLSAAERAELEFVRLAFSTSSEREALGFMEEGINGPNVLVASAAGPLAGYPRARARAYDAAIRWRASILAEMAFRRRVVRESGDPELARLADQLAAARRQAAEAVFDNDAPVLGAAPGDRLDEAIAARDQAERALAARSRSFARSVSQAQVGLEAVAAALPPASAMVSFVIYVDDPYAAAEPTPPPSYLAFVLRAGSSTPEIVLLGSAATIDALALDVRDRLVQEASAPGRSPKRGEAAYREAAARLRRKIWDPLAPHLAGVRRIFLVPDGSLNLVDFDALPVGSSEYLIEAGPSIAYLSAERDIVPAGDEPSGKGILIVGAPAFDAQSPGSAVTASRGSEVPSASTSAGSRSFRGPLPGCADFRSLRFDPLPAAAAESQAIASLWQETATKHRNGANASPAGAVTLLAGETANESAFKREAPGKRVLHLATHGFFLGGGCRPSDAPGLASVQGIAENPLLLAGLGFAGANGRDTASPDGEDGILTAEEISALDLSGVEWVALSACDTGLGQVRSGEGVFGLRRAFRIAGAGTSVMSLWPVEDETARRWMTRLYHERLVHARPVHEAARLASLHLLRARREEGASTHPFNWAGFVATGGGR